MLILKIVLVKKQMLLLFLWNIAVFLRPDINQITLKCTSTAGLNCGNYPSTKFSMPL